MHRQEQHAQAKAHALVSQAMEAPNRLERQIEREHAAGDRHRGGDQACACWYFIFVRVFEVTSVVANAFRVSIRRVVRTDEDERFRRGGIATRVGGRAAVIR